MAYKKEASVLVQHMGNKDVKMRKEQKYQVGYLNATWILNQQMQTEVEHIPEDAYDACLNAMQRMAHYKQVSPPWR